MTKEELAAAKIEAERVTAELKVAEEALAAEEERLAAEEAVKAEAEAVRLAALTPEELAVEQAAAALADANADANAEIVVTIGDTPPKPPEEVAAPEWVRELRKTHRETQKKLKELEEENAKLKAPAPAAGSKLVKPTLEGCDYDSNKYEVELTTWYDSQRGATLAAEVAQREETARQVAWNTKLEGYSAQKVALKAKDFDDAEDLVKGLLNITQQGIIIQGSANPALLMLALGRNPEKAKELAAITEPVLFTFAVAQLETQLKTSTNRPKPPAPEKIAASFARTSGAIDSRLDALRAEAEKTGDISKVLAYKQQKAASAKK